MGFKLLCAVCLFILPLSLCQEAAYSWLGDETLRPDIADDGLACDTPFCVEPCPEAASPRYCPRNMTSCASGCVCMLECRAPAYVCFQTKFCMLQRRYLKRTTKNLHYASAAEE